MENETEPVSVPEMETFNYRPAGLEGAGCFLAGVICAFFNALNLINGYLSEPLMILISVTVNLIFAAGSGLVWCLVDEVKIGEDKIFETLFWVHPKTGERRVLKQYEYWRNDYTSVRVRHGWLLSHISLEGKHEGITSIALDRVFQAAAETQGRAEKIAEKLDLPLHSN